jgi:hypothetical protein
VANKHITASENPLSLALNTSSHTHHTGDIARAAHHYLIHCIKVNKIWRFSGSIRLRWRTQNSPRVRRRAAANWCAHPSGCLPERAAGVSCIARRFNSTQHQLTRVLSFLDPAHEMHFSRGVAASKFIPKQHPYTRCCFFSWRSTETITAFRLLTSQAAADSIVWRDICAAAAWGEICDRPPRRYLLAIKKESPPFSQR